MKCHATHTLRIKQPQVLAKLCLYWEFNDKYDQTKRTLTELPVQQSNSPLSSTPSSPPPRSKNQTNTNKPPPPKPNPNHKHTQHPQVNEFLNRIFDPIGELMQVKLRITQLAKREREAQQIFAHGSQKLRERAERVQENNSRHLRLRWEIRAQESGFARGRSRRVGVCFGAFGADL